MTTTHKIQTVQQVGSDFKKISLTPNVYKSLQCLAALTKKKLLEHNILKVKTYLSIVQKIYNHGNQMVKNAIEDVFIKSFSELINKCNTDEQELLRRFIPFNLKQFI